MRPFSPSNPHRKKWLAALGLLAGIVAAFLGWRASAPELRFEWMGNRAAHCTGCGTFLRHAFVDHASEHDGWHPRGGPTSLTNLLPYHIRLGHLTTHALIADLVAHHGRTGQLSTNHLGYRYNDGLRIDDSEQLILFYYHRPTVWTSRTQKGKILGRNVLDPTAWHWRFIPEDEFQQRQEATLALLREREERAGDIAFINTNLVLIVRKHLRGTNDYRFTAAITNRSAQVFTIQPLENHVFHKFTARAGHSKYEQTLNFDRRMIAPWEALPLPGELTVRIIDTHKNGGGFHRRIETSSAREHGTSGGVYPPNANPRVANQEHLVDCTLRVTVESTDLKPVTLLLRSQRVQVIE